VFGGFQIALIVLACIGVIVGLVKASGSLESTSRCGLHGDHRGVDAFNSFTTVFGLCFVAVGLFVILGGSFGAIGAFQKNHCCVVTSASILGICMALTVIVALSGMFLGGAISSACDIRVCNTYDNHCHVNTFKKPECAKWDHRIDHDEECNAWCIDHYEYLCNDVAGKASLAGFVFFIIAGFTIGVGACACGAGCCCKAAFGMVDSPIPGQPPVAAVTGQPVTVVGKAVPSSENNPTV